MKKTLDISSVYICIPKIMIRWCTVPEIWCAMDGQTDRWTDRKSDIYRWVPHLIKLSFSSKWILKCFWLEFCITGEFLKCTMGWVTFWLLQEKTTSWACSVTSGLNDIFHWYTQLKILIKSSFSCNDDKLISWTTEKIEVSSPNSLAVDDKFLDRSLIYTKILEVLG